jgi:hypothetical protein
MEDGSVMRMRDDGKIVFIGSNDREFLQRKGDEIEYFRQIFGAEENYKQGVYSCDLKNRIKIIITYSKTFKKTKK